MKIPQPVLPYSPLGERLINPLFPAAFRTLNASNRLRNCCSAGKANRKSLFWSCYTLWGNSKMACFDKLKDFQKKKHPENVKLIQDLFENLKSYTYSRRTDPFFPVLVVTRYTEIKICTKYRKHWNSWENYQFHFFRSK